MCGQLVFASGGGRLVDFEQLPGRVLRFRERGEAELRGEEARVESFIFVFVLFFLHIIFQLVELLCEKC